MYAPIVLFVYNRPWHTRKTLEALTVDSLANESDLFIFADGPKAGETEENLKRIKEVQAIISEKKWCKSVQVIASPHNKGLASSVTDGVTDIVNRYGRIIVLEDDLVVAPSFLTFMNQCLSLYENRPDIYAINGFMFPVKWKANETVLLPYTSTWGWATWKDRWACYDTEMKGKEELLHNKELADKFNLVGFKYTDMLNFGNNSWGIRWYYSVFKRNGLCVFPTHSLVNNIGFDGSGVNSEYKTDKDRRGPEKGDVTIKLQTEINPGFFSAYLKYFTRSRGMSGFLTRIFKKFSK